MKNTEINRFGKENISGDAENQIRVDGFKQVIDMLRVADPAFRESLLKRLAARDPELVRNLIRTLKSN